MYIYIFNFDYNVVLAAVDDEPKQCESVGKTSVIAITCFIRL